ncbi:energy-coupling factor transporter transmembrane component T family protein [Jeotgalibaca ciconiae]|uniref:Energy-coupling factor transporter transmembrane protein EcfT n=1 Tax=Jeotgalibaca ciconiae TaxID=2496265 RepID=A0A3Q9BJU4_9LACT|nr:energy-coupling factor transporter transmembrane component T [Jeotgalibaca ciconiae]AZP03997.1 energy-coupling factor transporter transmembrane protein EcfT [Jeotgalibaca ciconiae]
MHGWRKNSLHPSEFAASLNKIGVNYKIAYSVSLALRYIPDIQRDFHSISQSQQARGVDISRNEKLSKRIKNISAIIFPLILSSLDRIEVISNAMELRGFGKNKKRSWYSEKKATKKDIITIVVAVIIFLVSLWVTYQNGGRFYNPFL